MRSGSGPGQTIPTVELRQRLACPLPPAELQELVLGLTVACMHAPMRNNPADNVHPPSTEKLKLLITEQLHLANVPIL